jgi:cytochrome c biogenesis protein
VVDENQAPRPADQPAASSPPAPQKPWYTPFLDFFSSVHVAVVILILLATISIIGTVLQQGDSQEDNLRILENFAAGFSGPDHDAIHATAQKLYNISEKLGFFELYQTWYFYTLLAALSTSLLVCSLRRWPQTWQVMARPRVELEESGFRGSPNRRSLTLRMSRPAAAEAVTRILGKEGYAVRTSDTGEAQFFYGQKGSYSRLGIYVTHFSIILVFIGGIIGVLAGYKGYMQITEGETGTEVMLRGNQGNRALPFQVRCDNFDLEYYPGSTRPKAFASDLVIIDGGREVVKKRIVVNDPLAYKGIWFYQSSYGETGRGLKANLRVTEPRSGRVKELQFGSTEPQTIPEFNVRVQIERLIPDFAMENGQPVSKSNQPRNPAVLAKVFLPDGESRSTWLFSLRPDIQLVKDLPVELTFLGFESLQYTGLQVVHDPGVWLIWVACTFMVIGIYFAFFVSHRRVWIRLREEGGAVAVTMAGNANKNRESFSESFERLGDAVQSVAEANR